MALSDPIELPLCDKCEKKWLPVEEEAQHDPRGYDARRRKAGLPPLRCGKCKTPLWDYKFTAREPQDGAQTGKDIVAALVKEAEELTGVPAVVRKGKRCKHGLLKCKECAR